MSFAHLHHHTTCSFLDGYGTVEQVAARLKELGHHHGAVTDHGNLVAHVPWQKAARAAGITPIFGCELYVVDDMRERTRHQVSLGASAMPHVTVLATNQVGYQHLLALNRAAWTEGFYYKPRVDWDELIRHQEGLAVLSGCVGGYPSRLIEAQGPEAAHEFLAKLAQEVELLFVELIPEPGLSHSHATLGHLVRIGLDLKLPLVLTADAHFPRPEDHDVQDLMLAVGTGQLVDDPNRKLRLPAYQYSCDETELIQRAREVAPEVDLSVWLVARDNAGHLAKACEVELPIASRVVFAGLRPGGEASADLLWRWVAEGAEARKASGQLDSALEATYVQRAQYEFERLCAKNYADYILAVADVCRWMKARDRLVTLRGSAGGCLLLWLVGASETDPIVLNLSFERFYDDSRPDPPDVDVDFERAYRQEAIDYVLQAYGEENCAQIAALSKLKAKGALQDACRALGIPRSEFAPLSSALDAWDEDMDRQLEEVTDPAALAVLRRHPRLEGYVRRIVGQYRQTSIHAAGVLVSNHPLSQVVGILRGNGGQVVAAIDKRGAAELGFLKMDFLSVSALDVVATTARRVWGSVAPLHVLPLDDPRALAAGRAGLLAGVFQLEGGAAARVAAKIGLDTFEDLAAAGGLCRPGPADWVPLYALHKQDPQALAAYLAGLHPTAAEVVRPTYGILLYQEQVMALAHDLAGLPWADVHRLRKGVADKLGLNPNTGPAWRAEWCPKFVEGCLRGGVSMEEASHWWLSLQSHGGYSFNRAHCTAYAVIGYWMLYLKAHHPAEFYEAYLQLEEDEVKAKRLVNELRHLGGEVRLLEPRSVQRSFSATEDGALAGGLTNLRGIGPKLADKVMAQGPFSGWPALLQAMPAAVAHRLRLAGADTGQWAPQELIALAPWFPVPCTGQAEAALRDQYGCDRIASLPRGEVLEGDVLVSGYVVAGKVDGERVVFALEDEGGMVVFRVPYRLVKALLPQFQELRVSDYVAVLGWWAGDVLYAKGVAILSRWQGGQAESAKEAGERRRQPKRDNKEMLADLMAMLPSLED